MAECRESSGLEGGKCRSVWAERLSSHVVKFGCGARSLSNHCMESQEGNAPESVKPGIGTSEEWGNRARACRGGLQQGRDACPGGGSFWSTGRNC